MFKDSFKYYKSKQDVPDFEDVINFDKITRSSDKITVLDLKEECFTKKGLPFGIKPIETWQCYRFEIPNGLIIIRNPFTVQGQRYWMARCIKDFPKKPNRVNLNNNLFNSAVLDDWWNELQKTSDESEARRIKISMRWATLGYHYNWDTKSYNENERNEIPKDLGKLSTFFADILGFENFLAEAAIINFYPIGSTLGVHKDDSEANLEAPLLSFSFGQTAVFLIGSNSKETKPIAMYLQSGDVLIMSKAARCCYHAVPRVMKANNAMWNELIDSTNSTNYPLAKKAKCDDEALKTFFNDWNMDMHLYDQVSNESFWVPYKKFINDTRINMNVRKVLFNGDNKLNN